MGGARTEEEVCGRWNGVLQPGMERESREMGRHFAPSGSGEAGVAGAAGWYGGYVQAQGSGYDTDPYAGGVGYATAKSHTPPPPASASPSPSPPRMPPRINLRVGAGRSPSPSPPRGPVNALDMAAKLAASDGQLVPTKPRAKQRSQHRPAQDTKGWSPAEDSLIRGFVSKWYKANPKEGEFSSWTRLSEHLKGEGYERAGKQCRER
jgi:hypothetical protein